MFFPAQRHNGDRYVGFSQQVRGGRRLGGTYPQNQFRQAPRSAGSAHSSGSRSQAASSGFSNAFSSGGSAHAAARSAPDEHASAGLKRHGSVPNLHALHADVPELPKVRVFNLHSAVSSGSSISGRGRKQRTRSVGRKRSRPVERGHGLSARSPLSAAAAAAAGAPPACPDRTGSGASTSACSLGRRVQARRRSKAGTHFLSRKTLSQRPRQDELSAGDGGHVPGSYKPSSRTSSQRPPDPHRLGFEPHRPETPSDQDGLCSGSTTVDSGQAAWSRTRNPAQPPGPEPSRTHSTPHHFGGYAITRWRSSSEQRPPCVPGTPNAPPPHKARAQKTTWIRMKPRH